MQYIGNLHIDVLCHMMNWNAWARAFQEQLTPREPHEQPVSYASRARHQEGADPDLLVSMFDTHAQLLLHGAKNAREARDSYMRLLSQAVPHSEWLQIGDFAKEMPPQSAIGGGERTTESSPATTTANQNVVYDATPVVGKKTLAGSKAGRKDRSRVDFLQQRRSGFKAALQYYQGKGSTPVPARVISFIQQRLRANKRDMKTVSRAHIACILRSSRRPAFSRYYRDISLIHATITGQPTPDVSMHETELMLMFDMGFFFFRPFRRHPRSLA